MMKIKNESFDNEEEEEEENDYDNGIASLFILPSERSSTLLTSQDLMKIKQIQQAYQDAVRLTSLSAEIPTYPRSVRISEASDMVNFPTNMQAVRVITYFKLLPEFSYLHEEDKLALTKYNTFALVIIRAALNYDPLTDTYHEPNTDDCVFNGRDVIQCFSLEQYQRSTRCIQNLVNASLNDRFLLQVLLIIILLSKGSALCTDMDEMEPIARNILSIFHTQNIFIELLWKYCENKFGYAKTVKTWLKLTVSSIDAHLQAHNTRRNYVKVENVADQLSPLMKSVMLII